MQIYCHSNGDKQKILTNEDETKGVAFMKIYYIYLSSIPYLMFVVSLLSIFIYSLSPIHMDGAKHVFKYIKSIIIVIEQESSDDKKKVYQNM